MSAGLQEFVPAEGAAMSVAPDGGLVAVTEMQARRVVILELPSTRVVAQIDLDADATHAQVAWPRGSQRLLVVTGHAGHTRWALIDPRTGARIVERRLAADMTIAATAGERVIATSATATTIVRATDAGIVQEPLPVRDAMLAVGSAGDRLVVAHEDRIEEWDLQARKPARRIRLSRPRAVTELGGNDQQLWLLADDDSRRIDVLPLAGASTTIAHELPEGIAKVVGHARSELVACIGALSGALYVIELGRPRELTSILPDGMERIEHAAIVVEPTPGVVAMQAGRPLVFVPHAPGDAAAPSTEAVELRFMVDDATRAAGASAIARDDSAYPPVPPPRPRSARLTPGLALDGLALRASTRRCSRGEYLTFLEVLRRYSIELAARAIARDWDSGRLAFSTSDRPPAESEVLGIAGRRSGLFASRFAEANEVLAEAEGAVRGARSALGDRMTPLDVLCAEHRISANGERVLVCIAAHAMWGEIARLYGVLANDTTRATCDEHLVWQLLGEWIPRRDIAKELDPESPLIRDGLVRINDRPRPFQALAANPVVIKLLSGAEIEATGESGIECVHTNVTLDKFQAPAAVIERAIAEIAAAPANAARVVVRGRAGTGRRTLLAVLAQLAGRTLATIDAATLIREKRLALLPAMLQHANLCGWLPCIDGLDTIPSDDESSRDAVRTIIRSHHGPVTCRIAHHVKPPLEPGYTLVDLPTPTISERAAQWVSALGARGLALRDADTVAARYTVGAGTIERTVETVARTPGRDLAASIDDAMRQHIDAKLGSVATRVARLADWSQIVLPEELTDSITELLARARHRRTVFESWGFDRVMSSSRGLTALFQGGPGTGKTLVASAIANELNLDLYRVDLSRVMSKWLGETEQNLGKLFDAAEEGQALILFDEADSLFGKRTEVRSSNDRYANLEVNYLLQRLDTFEGVAILTTNFGTAIDPAFKRRLSVRLTFPFPDEEARERLWRVHLPEKIPRAGKFDLAALARRYRMSGGYIRNAALRAAFLAADEDTPLTQDHLERAVRAEFNETGKLAESGQLE